jgi:hypothetical protein
MSKINAFSKSQQSLSTIHLQLIRSLTRTENTKRQSLSLPPLSLWANFLSSHPPHRRLPLLPLAGHTHSRCVPPCRRHISRLSISNFPFTLEIGLPAGVDDDGPRFGSPPILPCRRFGSRCSCTSSRTAPGHPRSPAVRKDRRRARAPAHCRRLRRVSRRQGAPGRGRERGNLKDKAPTPSSEGASRHQGSIFSPTLDKLVHERVSEHSRMEFF